MMMFIGSFHVQGKVMLRSVRWYLKNVLNCFGTWTWFNTVRRMLWVLNLLEVWSWL